MGSLAFTANTSEDIDPESELEARDIGELYLFQIRGRAQRLELPMACRGLHMLLPLLAGGVLETGGRSHELKLRTAYVIDSRDQLVLEMASSFTHLLVNIPEAMCGPAKALLKACEGATIALETPAGLLFASAIEVSFGQASAISSNVRPIVARSLVDLLNAALAEAVGAGRSSACGPELQHRMRIYEHVAKELTDPSLNVGSIAAAVGLSVRRVHQVFASADMPLMHWVWSERLSQCHGQLLSGAHQGRQIGDIAYEWGFNDPAHFSRVFKKRYGQPPSQYLKQRATVVSDGNS